MRLPWTAGGHRAERGRNVFQTAGTKYSIIRIGAGGDSASGFFVLCAKCALRGIHSYLLMVGKYQKQHFYSILSCFF